MPPRTRKTAQSKPDPDEAAAEPTTEGDDEETPEAPAEPQDSDDSGACTEDTPGPDGDKTPEPERSDLQAADTPCTECFPNGWPAQAYSVGCAHGTWVRETTD